MKGAVELIVLISTFIAVANCELCTTGRSSWSWYTNTYTYTYETCDYECCGDWPYEYCCGFDIVWPIVGGVIGGIIFIACIIACICCIVKQQGHRGRVIAPATTGVTTIAYTTPGAQPGAQPYGYGYQQPAPGFQQPAPGYQQPAPGYQQSAPPAYGQSGGMPPPPPNYAAPGQSSQDPAFPPTAGQVTQAKGP